MVSSEDKRSNVVWGGGGGGEGGGGGGVFFFNDTATTEIYTLSLHDALPIYEILNMLMIALEWNTMLAV